MKAVRYSRSAVVAFNDLKSSLHAESADRVVNTGVGLDDEIACHREHQKWGRGQTSEVEGFAGGSVRHESRIAPASTSRNLSCDPLHFK